jgi:hypothetical protein
MLCATLLNITSNQTELMKLKIILVLSFITVIISCSSNSANQVTSKKFKEADNTAVFTTKFVVIDKKDIITVTHEKEDGAWQFFSSDHFDHFEDVVKVVGLGYIVKLDNTLFELADMPEGYVAHRKFKGDKWIIDEQSKH